MSSIGMGVCFVRQGGGWLQGRGDTAWQSVRVVYVPVRYSGRQVDTVKSSQSVPLVQRLRLSISLLFPAISEKKKHCLYLPALPSQSPKRHHFRSYVCAPGSARCSTVLFYERVL